jgi:hypothetical protein
VQAVVSRTSQTENIILFNLAAKRTDWSPFAWLGTGQRMSLTIDQVLLHLKRAGILEDMDHIFGAGTTNGDPSHARRALRTILLATQMIAMQGPWDERADYVERKSPDHLDLVNSLALHVEPLVKFFVCNGYLYIHDLDANMSGTQDIHQHLALNGFYAATVWILVKEVLALGPSLLLLLLERKRRFSTAKDFMIWVYRLRRDPEPRDMNRRHHILLCLSDTFRWMRVEHRKRWRDLVDDFGIKNPGDLDLTQWAKAFPDEDTWADSMFQWRWIGPEQSVRKLLRLPSQA